MPTTLETLPKPHYPVSLRLFEATTGVATALGLPKILSPLIVGGHERAFAAYEHANQLGNATQAAELSDRVNHLAGAFENFRDPLTYLSQVGLMLILTAETLVGDRKQPETFGQAIMANIWKTLRTTAVIAAPGLITELPYYIDSLAEGQNIASSAGDLGVITLAAIETARALFSLKNKRAESRKNHDNHVTQLAKARQVRAKAPLNISKTSPAVPILLNIVQTSRQNINDLLNVASVRGKTLERKRNEYQHVHPSAPYDVTQPSPGILSQDGDHRGESSASPADPYDAPTFLRNRK